MGFPCLFWASARRGLRDAAGGGPAAAAELGAAVSAADGQCDPDGAAGGGEAG